MANNLAPAPIASPIPAPAPAPTSTGGEYVVARGDTLATIAKKNGVSLRALRAANPGVDPRKLKIGAKLELPESANATAGTTSGGATGVGPAGTTESGDVTVYTVKAGDMLGRIAKAHGTTVAKIKALNDLKTTSIKVGQKLKLPGARNAEPSTATSAPAPSATTAEGAGAGLYAAAQPSGAMTH
jgi:LysM repeat protein